MWGRWYWPLWLGVALATMLAPEIYALATGPRNTLSYWVWARLRITAHESIASWSAVDALSFGAWLVLVTWLTVHFWLRRWE